MSEFMAELRQRSGNAAKALEFVILTASRSGEVRGAKWSEIDLSTRLWVVPADRMKIQREHRVPLSDAAIELLQSLTRIQNEDLVFPSAKPDTPLSDMTLTALMKRMHYDEYTVHGFRSSFRDWAGEVSNYPSDMAELALAHTVGDKVMLAYRRGDMLRKRFEMMNDWAAFCRDSRSALT
jgi:integrase